MDDKTKHQVVLGGTVIVGIIILLLLLRGSKTLTGRPGLPDTALPDQAAPYVITYNFPPLDLRLDYHPPSVGNITIGIPPASGLPSCGCTGAGGEMGSPFYASIRALRDSYNSQLENFAEDYLENVLAGVPDYAKQYFNNIEGAALARQSYAVFS